ncbi:hypothetical protein H3H36_18705 [Duganella sp. FT3S]|uniref:Uncharacterized protein n=1 Tax=Rugamonas fusca TaxID=2758568 RepID=A0A7W2EK51_9BURK|nr:hypothetical protein [Rugamonas fusca]MBA5607391.1 hypothetical protein [Rugamonas fusca]
MSIIKNLRFIIRHILMFAWLAWCLWWLIDGLCSYSTGRVGDFAIGSIEERRMTGILAVMLVGFPSGFFGPAFFSDLMHSLKITSFDAGPLGYLALWFIAAVMGYLQWFVFLPLSWRMWKKNRKSSYVKFLGGK